MRTIGRGAMVVAGSLLLGLLAGCGDSDEESVDEVGSIEVDGVERPLYENEDGDVSVIDEANAPLCADVYADGAPMSEILEFESYELDEILDAPPCLDDEGEAVVVASVTWDCDGRDILVNDYGWGSGDGSGTWTAEEIRGCSDVGASG